ncbi:hypothetical protein GZH47_32355 (plasmid) [Paenibacillus rhizovicinus]|uniref:Uncharacterized protein n=1 Tax=Paenibacillus rhizovicinus TaxID=2704463 RepID=A0A6C0PAR1_9BACL|nr:hypothetical protein [Paenibacillus rhizovicinus]QHW35579.1 hypothetical protein GZH47_32355 [Paenibacillus rhizovicinus]
MSSIFKESSARKAPEALISKMRAIVEEVVAHPKFRSDFEVADRNTIDQQPGIYAWYVYDCGTHLMPLKDLNAVLEFQREWIGGMKVLSGKKHLDDDQLYVLNARTGDLRRVMEFKTESNLIEKLLLTAI